MKNYSKSDDQDDDHLEEYLENLNSKEYFEFLTNYYYSWKKSCPLEFNHLFGKNRDPEELAYLQLNNDDRLQICQ